MWWFWSLWRVLWKWEAVRWRALQLLQGYEDVSNLWRKRQGGTRILGRGCTEFSAGPSAFQAAFRCSCGRRGVERRNIPLRPEAGPRPQPPAQLRMGERGRRPDKPPRRKRPRSRAAIAHPTSSRRLTLRAFVAYSLARILRPHLDG